MTFCTNLTFVTTKLVVLSTEKSRVLNYELHVLFGYDTLDGGHHRLVVHLKKVKTKIPTHKNVIAQMLPRFPLVGIQGRYLITKNIFYMLGF